MKKIYAFIFVLFTLCSYSQSTYYKMLKQDTTTWQHFSAFVPVGPNKPANVSSTGVSDFPVVAIDTITINNLIYKKIYQLQSHGLNYSGKSLSGYMREDTVARKIYFKETISQPEVLLYDFSMNINDSIQITFPYIANQTGYYRVDSIKIKNENCGPRRHFYLRKHLNNPQPTAIYLDVIESIGCTYHILYKFDFYGMGPQGQFVGSMAPCRHPWQLGISCKHDDMSKQFQSCTFMLAQQNSCLNPVDSCNYRNVCSNLKSNDWDRLVKIGPNPTNDKIEVSIEQSFETITISVTDMAGKIIFSPPNGSMLLEKNYFSFSTKDLAPGIYILQVKLNETLIKRPIVVQR